MSVVTQELLFNLATALAVGLLIGTERGWSARDSSDGQLVAGIRTFGLTGLFGGLAALVATPFGVGAWIAALIVLGLLAVAGYLGELRAGKDHGLTSEVALLLTFLLGSLAVSGERTLAASAAVVVALLLSLKSTLHGALRRLSEAELSGALKLLFISVVLLPVLPNQGYGPWQVFNPYTTWWMVVLIAALGFAAYVAIRLAGTRYGLMLTALLGGIVSSTAMTLTLARLHTQRELRPLLAAGVLATSALMFPRILLIAALFSPALLVPLAAPLGLAGAIYAIGALYHWRSAHGSTSAAPETPLKNPFELLPALRFALLLALILLLVEVGRRHLGDAGVYLVSLLSGLTDVDAITLSLAKSSQLELSTTVAAQGIALAALSNSLVKTVLIAVAGDRALLLRTVPFIAAGLLSALVTLWLF